ncbi:MAG: ChbG/HpnK family deacetylase [Methylobacteriaceae bacterium]|nr:ChbG/HpnK family deacetylase [Methylobacteriaceae bacterium]
MFRFALCADDYAITPGVSRGILELLKAGRLTAVSVLVTAPEWARAASELMPFTDAADIGLHLNLTLGAPLGAMPALAPGKRFPALGRLVRAALLGQLPLAEIAAETARQIDAFTQHFGRPPDYLDGHQHVHALPGIRDVLLQTLAGRGLAGRLWLRDPGDRAQGILGRPFRRKAAAVAALTSGFARRAAARGFAVNEGFAGFSDFAPARDYAAIFPSYLHSPGPRHLVMCHPGHSDEALARLDPATSSRDAELAFLMSPDFSQVLATKRAGLMRISEAPQSH